MEDKKPLTYEPPAGSIPRWQFRLLFFFVLLNLAITIQSVYAPGVAAAVKQKWTVYQESRRVAALQRQASDRTEPPEKVIWDDNPTTSAELLAGSGYVPVGVPVIIENNYPFLVGWLPGAAARTPSFAKQLFQPYFPFSKHGLVNNDNYAVVLMHKLKSPAGLERLVYVYLHGKTDLGGRLHELPDRYHRGPIAPLEGVAERWLKIIAVPCLPADGANLPKTLSKESNSLTIDPQTSGVWKVDWRWVPAPDGKTGRVVVDRLNLFRFYAGQVDVADPSHFTIRYEYNSVAGTIHGNLRDDGFVDLKPEAGTLTGDRWNPSGK